MTATVIKMSVQRMVCTGCGAEANASCNCGLNYMPKAIQAAEAIKANPTDSNRVIANKIGVALNTVRTARAKLGVPEDGMAERRGLDGKTYSLRQRITDDPDIDPELVAAGILIAFALATLGSFFGHH